MTAELAERLLTDAGTPLAILAFVGWAIWRAASWFAVEIVKPLAARTVKTLDNLDDKLDRFSSALESIAQDQRELRAIVEDRVQSTPDRPAGRTNAYGPYPRPIAAMLPPDQLDEDGDAECTR